MLIRDGVAGMCNLQSRKRKKVSLLEQTNSERMAKNGKDMVTKNLLRGLPWQSRAKTSPSNAGDVGSLPGLEAKIPPASTAKKKNQNIK